MNFDVSKCISGALVFYPENAFKFTKNNMEFHHTIYLFI